MTRIDFYFNVANKKLLLSELVQGALNKRRKVTVLADNAESAHEISASLWQQQIEGFAPNVLVDNVLALQTPVIVHWQQNELLQDDMLINFAQVGPSFFSRFTQLVELVGEDEQDKVAARARYKFYRDRGYEVKNINHAQA
jgi:DNA polymerase-3 subunit chi